MLSDEGLKTYRHLQKAYRASFEYKRNLLSDAWQTVESSGWDQASTTDLRQLIHRLAGSAAIYGFKAISHHATELEVLFLSCAEKAMGDESNAWLKAEITQCVGRLMRALESEAPGSLEG